MTGGRTLTGPMYRKACTRPPPQQWGIEGARAAHVHQPGQTEPNQTKPNQTKSNTPLFPNLRCRVGSQPLTHRRPLHVCV